MRFIHHAIQTQYCYGILPLELEIGRYKGVDRENRLCTLCNEGVVEDQIHFAFKCSSYDHFRLEFYNICNDRIAGWDNMTDLDRIAVLFGNQPRLFGKYVKKMFSAQKKLIIQVMIWMQCCFFHSTIKMLFSTFFTNE